MVQSSWQDALNSELTQRLLRPWVSPGVIPDTLARSIFERSRRFKQRLSLLHQFQQRWSQQGQLQLPNIPIVYAQWSNPLVSERSSVIKPDDASDSSASAVVPAVVPAITINTFTIAINQSAPTLSSASDAPPNIVYPPQLAQPILQTPFAPLFNQPLPTADINSEKNSSSIPIVKALSGESIATITDQPSNILQPEDLTVPRVAASAQWPNSPQFPALELLLQQSNSSDSISDASGGDQPETGMNLPVIVQEKFVNQPQNDPLQYLAMNLPFQQGRGADTDSNLSVRTQQEEQMRSHVAINKQLPSHRSLSISGKLPPQTEQPSELPISELPIVGIRKLSNIASDSLPLVQLSQSPTITRDQPAEHFPVVNPVINPVVDATPIAHPSASAVASNHQTPLILAKPISLPATAQSTQSLANMPPADATNYPSTAPNQQSALSIPASAPQAAQPPPVNINRLTRQVERQLTRRLTVERERRGQRW